MAAKVNTKFVIILATGVLVLFGVVAFVALKTMGGKSAPELATLGAAEESKGDWEKAAGFYSRAVNKGKGNPEYIRKWIASLEHITPTTQQLYRDRFSNDYLLARRALAEALPTDVQVQRDLLDSQLSEMRMAGVVAGAWENFIAHIDDVIRNIPEGEKVRQILRRYRGIAATNLIPMALEKDEAFFIKGREDLEAALAADPSDAAVAAAIGDWYRSMADRARGRNERDKGDKFIADGHAFLTKYVSEHPINSPVRLSLIQMDIDTEASKQGERKSVEQILESVHPQILSAIEQYLKEPAESADRLTAWQFASLVVAAKIDPMLQTAIKPIEHVLSKRPDDVYLLFKRAELDLAVNDHAAAVASLQKVVDLPNRPLSSDGLLLFNLRDEALARQADAALAMWQLAGMKIQISQNEVETARDAIKSAKTDEEKTKATEHLTQVQAVLTAAEKERDSSLADAKKFRAKYADTVGNAGSRGLLLDGKIKFADGDLIEARRLLTQYNEQTSPPRSDRQALKFLAEVLRRQQNLGGARTQLERVLELEPRDVEAMLASADIELRLRNDRGAARFYEQILNITRPDSPQYKAASEQLRKVNDRLAGDRSDDKLTAALSAAGKKTTETPADFPGALAIIRKAADELAVDENSVIILTRQLIILNDRAKAREVVTKALVKDPENKNYKMILGMIDEPDPVKAQQAAIDQADNPDLTPLKKAMLKYSLLLRASRHDDALVELENAKKIDSNDPLVISAMFDEALLSYVRYPAKPTKPEDIKGQADAKAEAKRLADLAVKNNIDKLGGLIFRLRMEQVEGRMVEAAALVQQAVDNDPLNPLIWRMLAGARAQAGQMQQAAAAYQSCLAIRPNDVDAIKGYIRTLLALGKPEDALRVARESKDFGANDTEFAEIWITLEGLHGGEEGRQRAIGLRQRQFENNPKDRNNAQELAILLMENKQYPESQAVITSLGQNTSAAEVVDIQAAWHAKQGDFASARKVYDDFIAAMEPQKRTAQLYILYGNFLKQYGDPKGALEVFQIGRPLQNPKTMEIDREIGDLCFDRGDWAGAIAAYQTARDSLGKEADEKDPRLLFREVEAYIKMKKFDEAEALAKTAPSENDLRALLLRAEVAVAQERRADAKAFLDRAVVVPDANQRLAYLKRAQFLMGDKETVKDSIADLQQALKLSPEFTPARQELAKVYFETADREKSIALVREGIKLSDTRDANQLRGLLVQLLMADQRPADALAEADAVLAKTKDPEWYRIAGNLAQSMGELPRAVGYYAKAWEVLPGPLMARTYCEAMLDLPKPDLDKVQAVLEDPKSQTEKLGAMLMVRARLNRLQKKTDASDADIKSAFTMMNPKDPAEVRGFFGDLMKITARPSETIPLLESTKPAGGFNETVSLQIARLKIYDPSLRVEGLKEVDVITLAHKDDKPGPDGKPTPESVVVLAFLQSMADTMFRDARYDLAVDLYRKVLILRPDDPNILNNLAYTLSAYMHKPDEALPLAKKAAEALSNQPSVLDTLGSVQLALAQLDEAEATLKKGLAISDKPVNRVPLLLHLAEVALARGDRNKAEDYFVEVEKALVQDPRVRPQFAPEIERVRKKLRN